MENETYNIEHKFSKTANISDESYKNIKTKLESSDIEVMDSEFTGEFIKFRISFKKKLLELLEKEKEYTTKSKKDKITSNVFKTLIEATSSEINVIKNPFDLTIFKDRIDIKVKKIDITDTSKIYLGLYFEHITSLVSECVKN